MGHRYYFFRRVVSLGVSAVGRQPAATPVGNRPGTRSLRLGHGWVFLWSWTRLALGRTGDLGPVRICGRICRLQMGCASHAGRGWALAGLCHETQLGWTVVGPTPLGRARLWFGGRGEAEARQGPNAWTRLRFFAEKIGPAHRGNDRVVPAGGLPSSPLGTNPGKKKKKKKKKKALNWLGPAFFAAL